MLSLINAATIRSVFAISKSARIATIADKRLAGDGSYLKRAASPTGHAHSTHAHTSTAAVAIAPMAAMQEAAADCWRQVEQTLIGILSGLNSLATRLAAASRASCSNLVAGPMCRLPIAAQSTRRPVAIGAVGGFGVVER